MFTFIAVVFASSAGAFVGFRFGAKTVEDLQAQLEAWKNAAESKVDEIKSKF